MPAISLPFLGFYILFLTLPLVQPVNTIMTYALRNVVLERCSFFTECFLTYAKSLVPLVNSLDNRHRKRISTMVFPQPRRSTVNLKRYMPRVYPMLRLSSWKQPIAEYTLRTPQIGLKALSQNYKRKPLEHVNVVVPFPSNSACPWPYWGDGELRGAGDCCFNAWIKPLWGLTKFGTNRKEIFRMRVDHPRDYLRED